MKQVILINHSWISLTLQRDGGWSFVHSPNKSGSGQIFLQKKTGIFKIAEWVYWKRVTYTQETKVIQGICKSNMF